VPLVDYMSSPTLSLDTATLACYAPARCVAGDSVGDLLSTANGRTWSASPVDERGDDFFVAVNGVSCATARLCVGVDDLGDGIVEPS
jgi:hypothetical protein